MGVQLRLMLVGAGVAVMTAIGALALALIESHAPAAQQSQLTTPAEARALGARWRQEKSAELGAEYARALVSAGLYDELLSEIEREGLFADNESSARIYRAEALIRQGRYDEAAVNAAGENPYFAYARARAGYGLASDVAAAERDVAPALRGPKELAAEAWLFRARIALDENNYEKAEAAARRAADEGAPDDRVEAISIERDIRAGKFRKAAEKIDARVKARRPAKKSPEEIRLSAMIRLRAGDHWGAVNALDQLRGVEFGAGHKLMSAMAKREVGDFAQAWALANDVLAIAPNDWRALDIAQAIAFDMNRKEVRRSLIDRLAQQKPALATLRLLQDPDVSDDEKFARLRALSSDDYLSAAASLFGEGVSMSGFPDVNDQERALMAMSAAARENDRAGVNAILSAMDGDAPSPLSLTLAGFGRQALGEYAEAKSAYESAAGAAPDFLAPRVLRARLLADEEDPDAAAAIMRAYLRQENADKSALVDLGEFEFAAGNMRGAASALMAAGPKSFETNEHAALFGKVALAAEAETRSKMLGHARVNAPSAAVLAETLDAAEDLEGAAAAFRLAVIAEPENQALLARYVAKMNALGRGDEAARLAELLEARRAKAATADGAAP